MGHRWLLGRHYVVKGDYDKEKEENDEWDWIKGDNVHTWPIGETWSTYYTRDVGAVCFL